MLKIYFIFFSYFFSNFIHNIECIDFNNNRYMFRNTLLYATSHCFMPLSHCFMQLFVELFHATFRRTFRETFHAIFQLYLITSTHKFIVIQLFSFSNLRPNNNLRPYLTIWMFLHTSWRKETKFTLTQSKSNKSSVKLWKFTSILQKFIMTHTNLYIMQVNSIVLE